MKIVERIRIEDLNSASVRYLQCLNCMSVIGMALGRLDVSVFGDETIMVPVGNLLLALRERLDKTPDGQPMIGFQCKCGNDTRLGEPELHHQPDDGWRNTTRTNAELKQIAGAIGQCEDHGPADYEKTSRMVRYETFAVRMP